MENTARLRLVESWARQQEERFRALTRASSSVVYRMNADWSVLLAISGAGFAPIADQPFDDYLERHTLPEERDLILEAVRRAVEHGRPFELEHRVRHDDGALSWFQSRAVPMTNAEGHIVEWIGMASDISARKAGEARLAQQRRLYEAILTNTPDLAYVWDREHRFIYANEGLLRMWGRTAEEALGRNCLELGYPAWHAERHDREIEQVINTRQPVRGEVPFTGTFGPRIYDYLLVPVIGADGEVEAVAGTTRDVTESRQLQATLVEADRRKDEFLATLGHELRNPLAPIRNAVRLLRNASLPPEKVQDLLAMIDRQSEHMVRLVDDLLDVARVTRGEVALRCESVDLRRVLADAVDAVAGAIEARGHELRVECPEELPVVKGDATRLAQIVQNLLDNAAKYTPPGGRIEMSVAATESDVSIVVKDDGLGLDPGELPRIFDLFSRLPNKQSAHTGGLGVGLALANRFVQLHGGRMHARSEGRGRGCEFCVTLPLQ